MRTKKVTHATAMKVNNNNPMPTKNSETTKQNNNVSIDEQECVIVFLRCEKGAKISTSDSTMKTKLDGLCEKNPDMYSLKSDNGRYKTYYINDKEMISFRQKKREMSEEMKAAASERFSKLHAEGKVGKKKKSHD